MITVFIISLLAVMSPGPDFFIVLRNSLVYSRKNGLQTAFGVSCALIAHITYTIVGIGVLIAESPFVYSLLTYIGACYLLYIGTMGIVSSFKKGIKEEKDYRKAESELPGKKAFMQGFLTNLLNPKCALYFISLFSQFITQTTPISVKITYGLINWGITIGWFSLLAYLVTAKELHQKLLRYQSSIDRVMGGVLVFLGMRLLFI